MINDSLYSLCMTHIESTKKSFVDRLIINDRTIYEVRNWVRKSYIGYPLLHKYHNYQDYVKLIFENSNVSEEFIKIISEDSSFYPKQIITPRIFR